MGQEILYCYKCQTRLLGSEFDKGKAFKVGGQAACAVCVKDLLAARPEIQAEYDRKLSSSSRMPAAASESGSGKFKPASIRAVAPPPPPPDKSKNTLIVAAVVGAVVILILVAMTMAGGRGSARTETPHSNNATAPNPPPPPPPPKPEDPKPPPPTPAYGAELREIDEKMRAAFAKEEFKQIAEHLDAARKRRATPEWLSEIDLRVPQIEARIRRSMAPLRDKALEAKKKNDEAEIQRLRDRIAAWGFPAFVDEFNKALAETAPPPPPPPPSPSNEPPLVIYDDALGPNVRNFSWNSTIDLAATTPVFEGTKSIAVNVKQAAGALYLHLDKPVNPAEYPFLTFAIYFTEPHIPMGVHVYADVKTGAVSLNQIGGLPNEREWKRYVVPMSVLAPSATKITGFVVQLYQPAEVPQLYVDSVFFLKSAESTTPPPPPKPATSELDGYRARWAQAAAKAALRDYAGAHKDLEDGAAALKDDAVKAESAADLELLKLAAQVPVEAAKAIATWPKGQKLRLDFLNGEGARESVEGTLVSADAAKIAVLREGGVFELPAAELLASALAELSRARPRAAAAFCLFEGDPETARKLWGEGPPIPEKLLGLAKERPAAEAAARKLFWAAEADFASPKRRPAAIEKYAALSAEARFKSFAAARLEAAKDTVFLADDLSAAGSFVLSGSPKIDTCWTGSADSPAIRPKEIYVEAEFHAFPGTAYRAWVWVGACCLETFEFSLQGSDLTIPNPKNSKEPLACEPGSDNVLAAKAPSITVKRWHAQHGGAKEPSKWEWFPVALPKYETPGLKKLRILSAQQGFSVGAVVVSALRRETPRDAEMKDLEKSRFGNRKSQNNGPMGIILHEYWLGIPGSTVEDLTKHASFLGKPSASSYREIFEGPTDLADNYGSRIRGYVHPTLTGAYTFWISSDDSSEFWISSDDSPAKKKLACSNTAAGGVRDWTRTPTSKSAPVPLIAGKRYYVEALHKDGVGGDHLAVGWTLPDATEERPIPGSRLSPWLLTPTSSGPPNATFYRALNLNGPPTVIDGRRWEGKSAPNHGTSSDGFDNQAVALNPPTDDARAQMIRCSVFAKGSTVVKLNQVPSGTYLVYLYVWEDNNPEIYALFVQNKEVLKAYNSGPGGHWEKLGPFTAVVSDSVLEVHSVGGDANFSGLEVWRLGK